MTDRAFLDIITNIFGVFILIILVFILGFKDQNIMMVNGIILPIEKKLKDNYYYLECTGNNISPVGMAGECDEDYYKIIKLDYGHMCIFKEDLLKNNAENFNFYNKNSVFYDTLKEVNSSDTYLIFLVRQSAFDYYHEITKIARNYDFNVGWYPLREEEPLIFSMYGREIGSQD